MAEKAKRELPSQLKQLLALDVKLSKDVMEAVNRFQPFYSALWNRNRNRRNRKFLTSGTGTVTC
jgi:hypothetical protein